MLEIADPVLTLGWTQVVGTRLTELSVREGCDPDPRSRNSKWTGEVNRSAVGDGNFKRSLTIVPPASDLQR